MTQRITRLPLAALLLGTSLSSFAQTPPAAPTTPTPPPPESSSTIMVPDGDAPISLQLNDADISLVLTTIEFHTGRIILRPPNLPVGKISISSKPMPKSEALRALETLLNLNGIGLIPLADKFIKVVPIQQVRYEVPELIAGSTLDLPASGRIATKIFQLEFIRANEFMQQFNLLFNPNLGTAPTPFEKTNAVMVTDSISTLQRIETILKQIDQPASVQNTLKFYSARNAKASDLVNKLRTVIQSSFQQQFGNSVSLNADDRTNQIVLVSDPRQHAFFDEMIAKLDIKADPNTRNEVISLKHATAKDVATLISNIVSEKNKASSSSGSVRPVAGATNQPGQPPMQPGGPQQPPAPQTAAPAEMISSVLGGASSQEFSSNITIQSDERSNAIVVAGTVDDIRIIKELIEKIDIILAQVRIEVVIAQVTLSDKSQTGIQQLGLLVQNDRLVGFNSSVQGASVSGSGITSPGTTGSLSSFATLLGPGALASQIALTTTPRKANATILNIPSITTTHNKEATFFSGETRPVISGTQRSTTTDFANTTVTQQEIGTTLKVKPLIGSDGSVQLDIDQEISEKGEDVIIDGNTQPVILKQRNKSFLTVKSGEIIVIGGLRKKVNSRGSSRLGPIPFIGDLLGTRTRENTQTELIFFLRPYVLTNTPEDNKEVMKSVDQLPQGKEIRKALDPSYQPPPVEKTESPALKRPR